MSNYKNISSASEEQRKDECDSLRTVTFFGVTLSTAAALICVVGVPMFYNQMQQIQSGMQSELDFCKSRAGNIWHEVTRTQILASVHPRTARAIHSGKSTLRRRYADNGYDSAPQAGRSAPSASFPAAVPPSSGGCCGCGHSPSGPPGPPGPDGQPGNDGNQGPEGRPGQDAPIPHPQPQPHWCFDCPPGPRGEPGSAGPKGPNGNEGMPGRDGKSPPPGPPGPLGPPGPAGENGQPGEEGHPGKDGIVREVNKGPGPVGPAGPPGTPGERGQPGNDGNQGYAGPQGAPGDVGTDGSPGKPGGKGEDGKVGDKGPTGSCDHCAQPRTPPGY